MTALRFLHCAFYDVEEVIGLNSSLLTHDSFLVFLLYTLAVNIDEPSMLRIVWDIK